MSFAAKYLCLSAGDDRRRVAVQLASAATAEPHADHILALRKAATAPRVHRGSHAWGSRSRARRLRLQNGADDGGAGKAGSARTARAREGKALQIRLNYKISICTTVQNAA